MAKNRDLSIEILSELTAFSKYARFNEDLGRRETWEENVSRVEEMHVRKFPELKDDINKAFDYVRRKEVVPSMRSMQFGGEAIEKMNIRIFNCSFIAIERPAIFSEIMVLLMAGTGVGYSVQYRHISKLPEIKTPKRSKKFVIEDTIEGWANALKALLKSYFYGTQLPIFDYSQIRPKGTTLKTSGGKAPGPDPLRKCLDEIQSIFTRKNVGEKLKPIEVHDIVCHIADCILAGGIRRSATIALFDSFDDEMLNCKGYLSAEIESDFIYNKQTKQFVGDARHQGKIVQVYLSKQEFDKFEKEGALAWYWFHPQRARANNSAVFFRKRFLGKETTEEKIIAKLKKEFGINESSQESLINTFTNFVSEYLSAHYVDGKYYEDIVESTTQDDFMKVWKACEASGSGEPGVFWTNDPDYGTNPCGEISLKSAQTCNLSSINVSTLKDQKDLENRVWAATLIGTLQATYDSFEYISENWQENQQDERLLGVSLTGICDIDYTKFDWNKASLHSAEVNAKYAEILGINEAARITCIKPEGTASCVMGTASGIHARHSQYYIRRVRYNKQEPIAKYLMENHPELVEEEEFNPLNIVVALPQKSPAESVTRENESAIDTLERVKFFNEHWVSPGHRYGPNQHNVSCTISVRNNEWSKVGKWMWENRDVYSGIAVLPYSDAIYKQAPFEECDEETYNTMMKNLKSIDLTKVLEVEDNTNLLGELACAGGACEVTFG